MEGRGKETSLQVSQLEGRTEQSGCQQEQITTSTRQHNRAAKTLGTSKHPAMFDTLSQNPSDSMVIENWIHKVTLNMARKERFNWLQPQVGNNTG
ncbi:hypothetical protein PoB_004837800 [Plakobranchus ocellatus]|uniref:Uncharacterized protein n=1 Tax=Plakobranchus ocellatus TaxID=259542 RepID=A0AAV4BRV9_9GAST|nr:hypothetical protein PoB_004837800 [Plakobranchus ocellatus]